ncbi:hypothetical protein [Rhizobium binae]|uniref:hypothetical protein n=1 Tax=Rhizobium binae TaxID=1138190 RepID=UPI001C837F47|nr:hypothetical protein [Rhizobium binae]MBX4969658.1 hypothetical protein [Rhizobium binae]
MAGSGIGQAQNINKEDRAAIRPRLARKRRNINTSRSHEPAALVKFTYAVVMGQKEPISAEVSCVPDFACDLVDHADAAVRLAITV